MNPIMQTPKYNVNDVILVAQNITWHYLGRSINLGSNPKSNNILYTKRKRKPHKYISIRMYDRRTHNKIHEFYSKFICVHFDHITRKFFFPEIVFKQLIDLCKELNLEIERFYTVKEENFVFTPSTFCSYKNDTHTDFYFKIFYYEIKGEIVDFLLKTIGKTDNVKEVVRWFVEKRKSKSVEKYLKKKASHLLSINLNDYIKKINRDTNKKIKHYRWLRLPSICQANAVI